jgi:outer membrane immunogenic protein
MKRLMAFAMLAAGITLGALPSYASDLPAQARTAPVYKAPPANIPYDWSGFYLGINGGYNFGRSSWSDPAAGADSGTFSTKGGLLGAQVGYNWQVGRTVLGVESDIDWTKTSGTTASGSVCASDGGGQCESKQSWFGTTRARLGYAFDRFLPYITGGAAYGDVKAVQPSGTSSDTKLGWAAGAGIEYGINKNWSAKAEYLHLDLGTATFMGLASGTNTLQVPMTDEIVRAGLNYHW